MRAKFPDGKCDLQALSEECESLTADMEIKNEQLSPILKELDMLRDIQWLVKDLLPELEPSKQEILPEKKEEMKQALTPKEEEESKYSTEESKKAPVSQKAENRRSVRERLNEKKPS